MKQEEILSILKEKQAVLEGHFILTSGKHADTYIQCARILQDPKITSLFVSELLKEMKDLEIDLVIGPATGGIIIAYEAARQLGVNAIFTERENGKMTLRRGFKIPKEASVLVVEDVVTTGGSVREVLEVVNKQGGKVVAIGLFADRTGGKIDFKIPTYRIFSKEIQSYEPENCPLCKKDILAIKPGSRGLK
ncbi:orotate phosphoribosyltransferase [Garciella nitratireducens]|uniref:Orotate phosphoribosyltransferase n=1 Tax=Garciella nitratireducens DSM 15102 TaxID=1121911 RepID=A0A1T4N9D3_9FIRM|nr:orotate phosphoribosyltransferase [Garciella nitratireducens]SJZ75910.1 orotate phosphoribosyltransferase [Garciella nitratireducens DSM 15102]